MTNSGLELIVLVVLLVVCIGPPLLLFGGFVVWWRRQRERRPAAVAAGVTIVGALATTWEIGVLREGINLSKGRLLRLEGRARTAQRVRGDAWSEPLTLDVSGLSSREREVLGALWHRAAELEHASVAAFSRLSLKLIALGAPAELVERTHLAALDEVRHARRCFAVARCFTGVAMAPGELPELLQAPLASAAARVDRLARLARASLIDGALGEGVAAQVAGVAATLARDPTLRETLRTISDEEARHAALAWDSLSWCLEVGGDVVAAALRSAAAELADQRAPELPELAGISAQCLAAHGVLAGEQLGAISAASIVALQARVGALLAARGELAPTG